MMRKTSELTGAALDWAVAKCKGALWDGEGEPASYQTAYPEYSTWWEYGGPIIEREKIAIDPDADDGQWAASTRDAPCYWVGPTPLIAAMRCYVASKLGDTVDVPDELND